MPPRRDLGPGCSAAGPARAKLLVMTSSNTDPDSTVAVRMLCNVPPVFCRGSAAVPPRFYRIFGRPEFSMMAFCRDSAAARPQAIRWAPAGSAGVLPRFRHRVLARHNTFSFPRLPACRTARVHAAAPAPAGDAPAPAPTRSYFSLHPRTPHARPPRRHLNVRAAPRRSRAHPRARARRAHRFFLHSLPAARISALARAQEND